MHLVALTQAGPQIHLKRYAREDRRMRSGLKVPPLRDADEPVADSIYEVLSGSWALEADRSWFTRRWDGGEREAMEAHGRRVVEEAGEVTMGSLAAGAPWTVYATPVLGNTAVAHGETRRLAVGPRCVGITACLALVAEQLRPVLTLDVLTPEQQDMVRTHTAGAALLAAQDLEGALDPWLPDLVEAILPRLSEQDDFQATLVAVAEALLDQPPGEIERIAIGLSQRRIPRLLRAWRRGFFVPPGFDLANWAKTT